MSKEQKKEKRLIERPEVLIERAKELWGKFIADAEKGSKASWQRARVASTELEKIFKDFRKGTVALAKGDTSVFIKEGDSK